MAHETRKLKIKSVVLVMHRSFWQKKKKDEKKENHAHQ